MRVGLIVDGAAEYYSLPSLLQKISCRHELLKPLKADIQPLAPVDQIVRAVGTRVPILVSRGVDHVVILVDRETREECPGDWPSILSEHLQILCRRHCFRRISVIIKNRKYENWLVADLSALQQQPKRFRLANSQLETVHPDKADHVNAERLLIRAAQGEPYDKIKDSCRIMARAEPLRIASNSRSFRRLLRVLEVQNYRHQSRIPG